MRDEDKTKEDLTSELHELRQRLAESEKDITEYKKVEDTLKESEEKFLNIFQHHSATKLIIDPDTGNIVEANEASEKFYGWSVEQLKEMRIQDINMLSAEQVKAEMEKARSLDSNHFEFRHRLADGSVKDVDVYSSKIEIKGKELLHSIVHDITERKRAEEKLTESEEKFRLAFRTSPDSINLSRLSDGMYLDINEGFINIMGHAREDVIGKTSLELNVWDDPKAREHLVTALRTDGFVENLETTFRGKGGRLRIGLMSARLLRINQEDVILSITRDITERKRAEEKLRESEEHFKAMFETASIGVAQADPKTGQWLRVNQKMCEITGYSSAELLTMRVPEITHPEDRERDWEAFQNVVNGRAKNYRIEKRYVRKDDTIAWVNVNMTVIRDLSGQPMQTIATIEDITERKRAEEEKQALEAQLRQGQKMEAVGTLAGGIAHEFNNILGIILGYSELARDDIPEWNPAWFHLDEIQAATLRAKDAVLQLLAFSRKTEENHQPLNLAPVVKEAIKFLRSSIPTNIEIRQNIAEGCHKVIADPTQIHQIILNLSTNAAHAMEETGGILEFSLQNITLDGSTQDSDSKLQPGEYVMFQVSDTGCGIPAETLDRIFDPYFTTKKVGKGTGMGLSVVHGIIEAHGGSIEVQSDPGKGTTFKILFPATKEESILAMEIEEELPTGNERILFIDDEPTIATLGRLTLERLGYQVQAETNPRKALEVFASNPEQFDLIITDTTMPGMTGDQLIKKVLQIRPDMKTILCTGYSERVDEESAITLGAKAYALKPLDRKQLAMTVRKVLDENT